jgi:hypothetical protein
MSETLYKAIQTRFEQMAGDRVSWESVWKEIVNVCMPGGPEVEYLDMGNGRTYDRIWSDPLTARRSRKIYDATGALALDRITSGIESIITPQGQQWHELQFQEPASLQPDLPEEEWLASLTEYLFGVRYDPRSGWLLSHQRALSSVLALGTGVYYISEAFGGRDRTEAQLPFQYTHIPLNEAYLAVNDMGEHDTCMRSYRMSNRQALDRWGDKSSEYVKTAGTDPARMDERSQYIHAVLPSEHVPEFRGDHLWASIYVDLDHKHVIQSGGFYEFPFAIYTWSQPSRSAYGESPAMVALADMKSLQVMSRDALLASQLNVRPPVATAFELDRPVNLNPAAVNPKMIDPNTGRPLVQPVFAPSDPRLHEATMEARRQTVLKAFFTDVFQTLADKPNMSATESMIRAQEKAETLGPAASRIQVGLSRCVDREIAILQRKGAFEAGALLEPSFQTPERDVGVKFTSPMDRARQLSEVTGMQQTLEFAAGLAQFAPDVLDNFDTDSMIARARYLLGAPPTAMRDPELVENLRQEKAAAMQAQQQGQQMAASADTAKTLVEAAGGLGPAAEGAQSMAELAQGAGIDPSMMAGIPQLTQ